jgi:hypothetical protein
MYKKLSILLAVALLLSLTIAPVVAQRSWWEMDNDVRIFGRLIVNGATTLIGAQTTSADLTVGTDLTVSDDLTVTDDTTLTDDLQLGGDLMTSRQTTVTVTSGGTVTPLGRFVPLTAAGAVGTSSIAGCTAGDTYSKEVIFLNTANQTITFTDTGTLKLSGNAALGQWDTLHLKCHTGTGDWIQVAPEGDN